MTKVTNVGHLNWEEVFKYIFAPWSEDNLINLLSIFADFNTATSHMKTEAITHNQQERLIQFILSSMYFLQKLNVSYRLLIKQCLYEKDRNYYFSFHNFQDRLSLSEIKIDQSEVKRLLQRMANMEEIIIDFNKPQYIETFYNMDYRSFVAILVRVLNLEEEQYARLGEKLSIIRDNAPVVFNLKLTKNIKHVVH